MRELPGDVFVAGQLSSAQMQALVEQGIMGFINNRPDMEAPFQPSAEELGSVAQSLDVKYSHLPMAGGLTPELIEASVAAFKNTPRPIVAFCASGMRSAALWAFAHVEKLGVDGVMEAIRDAGFNLEQLRQPLAQYSEQAAMGRET